VKGNVKFICWLSVNNCRLSSIKDVLHSRFAQSCESALCGIDRGRGKWLFCLSDRFASLSAYAYATFLFAFFLPTIPPLCSPSLVSSTQQPLRVPRPGQFELRPTTIRLPKAMWRCPTEGVSLPWDRPSRINSRWRVLTTISGTGWGIAILTVRIQILIEIHYLIYRFQSQLLLLGRRASKSTSSTESTKTSRIWVKCSMDLSLLRNTFKE